jgi:hypothetical protein
VRFDPVWRRIKGDVFTSKLEGRFGAQRDRLDALSNWGVLSWLYPHASASKLVHHYGLEHNACVYLESGVPDREKYRASFRVAAHVLHWGHLPLSYAAEEAVLRAAHVNPDASRVVAGILKDVSEAGALECTAKGHDCMTAVAGGDRYFDLYRWMSAWMVVSEWKKLWKAIKDACDEAPDEVATKHQIIRTLVCREDRGYKILAMCNRADFVPRDLLQSGTAWLSFDVETLWETNPLGSDAAKEWSLVSAAEEYLDRRFFRVPESLLIHSLASRAIAGGFVAEGVTREFLKKLMKEGDSYYATKFPPYHRKRLVGVQTLATGPRLSSRWEHVGSWDDVSLPLGSRFSMEDHLTGRSGTSRLSYPFSEGINVFVERTKSDLPSFWAGAGRGFAAAHLHHETKADKGGDAAFSALQVVGKISDGLPPGAEPGDSLMSWLLRQRTSQSDDAVGRAMRDILISQAPAARAIFAELIGLKTVGQFLDQRPLWLSFTRSFADGSLSNELLERFGSLFLRLPWWMIKLARGKAFMALIRTEAVNRAASKGNARGYALEAATIADQWAAPGDPQRRFVFFNCYMLGKDQQPEKEFDVVRVDLFTDRTWTVTAVECAVSRSERKDVEGREKLELLRTRLQGRFGDLKSYVALFAEPGAHGDVSYEDAGRGFTTGH